MTTQRNEDTSYLTPEQHAQRIVEEKEFFVCIWDVNPFRFSKRVSEAMKLGYTLSSQIISHTQYEDTGNHGVRVPNRSILIAFMYNEELFREATRG